MTEMKASLEFSTFSRAGPSQMPTLWFHHLFLPSSCQEQALAGPEGASEEEEQEAPSPPGAQQRENRSPNTHSPGLGWGAWKHPSTHHPPQHFSCEGDWQGLSQGLSQRLRDRPGSVSGSPPPPWRPRRPAEGGQGVNSRENSDKWAPPPRPLPPIKAKPSQRRCRNHFQARHDINISAISGGQWGVRLREKHRWIRPAPDTQADGKYHCLSAVS